MDQLEIPDSCNVVTVKFNGTRKSGPNPEDTVLLKDELTINYNNLILFISTIF